MLTEKTFVNPKIEIRKSSIAGKGMFAKEDIAEGETVIKWGGRFFTTDEINIKNKDDFLLIQIDENLWSAEEYDEYEDDYFINHSCDSNCWMIDGRTFVAKVNIKKCEEITADYSLFESEDYVSKWECKCSSIDCRKIITGKDCLLTIVQEKYANHFSPVVQKRIDKNKH